jgi:hypothetical protein
MAAGNKERSPMLPLKNYSSVALRNVPEISKHGLS